MKLALIALASLAASVPLTAWKRGVGGFRLHIGLMAVVTAAAVAAGFFFGWTGAAVVLGLFAAWARFSD